MDDTNLFMHEIKNSLSNIYLLSELLDNEKDGESIKKYSKLIRESINQIRAIEKDYNDYRKLGVISNNHAVVNLKKVICDIIEEYKVNAEEKKITIDVDIKTCFVVTDATKIKQVMSNLVSNAIKYNRENGSVYIRCMKVGANIFININDTGIGMSEDELSKIGEPFYRSKRIDVLGTGLGISLVKKIVKFMNWKLDISSKFGTGTTITVVI